MVMTFHGCSQDAFLLYAGVGAVLFVVCLVLALGYRNAKQFLDELWAVDTYEARDLRRMCKGGFDATVEVQGMVSCSQPLVSLAAQVPCCWFHTKVEREERKTRTVTDTDSDGRRHIRNETYYEWETEFDRTFTTIFEVRDETGVTFVDPDRADIQTETVFSREVSQRQPWFDSSIGFSDTGDYRISEEAFLPERYAFVIGEASERDGGVVLHYPKKGYLDPRRRHFVISRKTENELVKSKQTTASLYLWSSVAAFLCAIVCLLIAAGVIRLPC